MGKKHFTAFQPLKGQISKNLFLIGTWVMERIYSPNFMFLDSGVCAWHLLSQDARMRAYNILMTAASSHHAKFISLRWPRWS